MDDTRSARYFEILGYVSVLESFLFAYAASGGKDRILHQQLQNQARAMAETLVLLHKDLYQLGAQMRAAHYADELQRV